MHIDAYQFGSMTVNGLTYTEDLIVFPERVLAGWWRNQGHSLAIDDLCEVVAYKPEILVVGCGSSSAMQIPVPTRDSIAQRGIVLIQESTHQAWQIFNQQQHSEKKVVGAFHLTC